MKNKNVEKSLQAETALVERLSGITKPDRYLEVLCAEEIKKHTLIVIAVKDTAGMAMTAELAGKLQTGLGCRFHLQEKHWKAYLAVISRGKVLDEQLSVANESVESMLSAEGLEVAVFSSIYGRENVSQILLDGTDYSRNSRGLNLVVYDWDSRRVCDAVCFDTHVPGFPCTRERKAQHCLDVRHSAAYLGRRLDELEEAVRSLEDRVTCTAKQEQLVLWQIFERAYGSRREAEQAFFRSLPKAQGRLRKIQKVGMILLTNFDRICKAHGIVYWLGFGTLLGAVRHGGFIPWDDDTDVCMTRDQLERLAGVMENEEEFYLKKNVYADIGNTIIAYHFQISGTDTACCLDIFQYDYCNDVSKENIEKQHCLNREMAQKGWEIYCKLHGNQEQLSSKLQGLVAQYQKRSVQETGILENPDGNALMWAIENVYYEPAKGSCVPLDEIFPLETVEFEGHIYPSPKNPEQYLTKIYKDIYALPDDMVSHQHFTEIEEDILDRILDERGL